MRSGFLIVALSIFCIGCKTQRSIEQHTFTTEMERVLPYDEVSPKKDEARHLALIIPDNPDTLNMAQSELSAMLVKKGYRVIIPGKPGRDVREKIELDSKSNRIKDINSLLSQFDTATFDDFIIVGIGEGGYLTPDISFSKKPKFSVVINAGPASPLAEYENLVTGTIMDQKFFKAVLAANLLFTRAELAEQISRIEDNPFGEPQLLGGSNNYWIGYKQDPLMNRIVRPGNSVVWMISEKYPLISNENKELAEKICDRLPYLNYKQLEGRGNFNDEEEVKILVKSIEELINNPPRFY